MKKLPIQSTAFQYIEKSFKEWLDILGYAETLVYSAPNHVREFFYFLESKGKIEVHQITLKDFQEHYNQLKHRKNERNGSALSNTYLNKHLQALKKFSEYLRQSGRLDIPYWEQSLEEAGRKTIDVVSVAQMQELYRVTDEHPRAMKWEVIAARDKAMLTVFYACGLRRNEGYHLDLSDINFDRQFLHVRKGKNYKERLVPFNKTSLKYLQTYVYDYRPFFQNSKSLDALFLSMKGYRMGSQMMSLRLKMLIQKMDDIELNQKDVSLHTLRHSIATHLLAAGMDLQKIQRFLGHSSLESTQIYTHLAQESYPLKSNL